MRATELANYEKDFRILIARLFNELMISVGVKLEPGGGFNTFIRSFTHHQNEEVNSLSFFNPNSGRMETLQVILNLNHDRQRNPVITISGSNGTKVTIFSEGVAKTDAATVRGELSRLMDAANLIEKV